MSDTPTKEELEIVKRIVSHSKQHGKTKLDDDDANKVVDEIVSLSEQGMNEEEIASKVIGQLRPAENTARTPVIEIQGYMET